MASDQTFNRGDPKRVVWGLEGLDSKSIKADDQRSSNQLWEKLSQAAQNKWTGLINVTRDGRTIGSVVLQKGFVAWAVSRGQSNSLGELLGKVGLLSSHDVMRAQNEYIKNKGRKKLGAILEEMGLIQRPVLRRCLLLHTRSALEELLKYDDAETSVSEKSFEADERIIFELGEILPSLGGTDAEFNGGGLWRGRPEWYGRNEDNEELAFLASVLGYQAAAVISAKGEILSAHCAAKDIDPVLIGIYLTSILDTSARTVYPNPLANVKFIYLECSDHTLVSRWIDEEKTHIIAVVLANGGGVGMAKYLMDGRLGELRNWLFTGQRKSQGGQGRPGH